MQDLPICVTPATSAELPALVSLLHEAQGHAPLEFLVARTGDRLVGGAVIVWREIGEPSGFPVWLRTMPDSRRRGIGTALFDAIRSVTADETGGIRSLIGVDPASGTGCFTATLDCVVCAEDLIYAIDTQSLHDSMQRVVRNLARPGKLPADTRVVALGDAPRGDVAALIADALPGAPAGSLDTLGEIESTGADRYRPFHSSVVLEGERVVGALLVRRIGQRWVVEANVAAADRRTGHVNALQLARTVAIAVDENIREVEFRTDTRNRHTMRVADYGYSRIVQRQQMLFQAASASD
ncbi:MAG: GNAT family N-acetyltransferase [Pseudomonadota bacterium]